MAPLFEKAGVLVFSSPLYWFGISAQLKLALDKLHPYSRPDSAYREKLRNKETVFMICGGNADPAAYKPAVAAYEAIAARMQWVNRGTIVVPAVRELRAINGHAALIEAENLGASV
jgi:multimeric flavodoxin WrbA